ncbi:MAG: insulinase family protein [Bacteroidia bacterium]
MKNLPGSICFILMLALLFVALPFEQKAQPESTREIPLDPKVIRGKLANGMTYYIRENQKPEDRAELRLAVNIGSLAETDKQQGLAHFVEHMAFNGTENFAKNDLIDYLELAGVKFGPHLNAYTSFDETVYMLQVPTDSQEVLDKALLVLQDWAGGVSFDGEEIEKERGVVIEEWRQRLGAETRMSYEYFPVLFKDSRYAERLPIGKKEVLENFDHETLKQFYTDWYRPELMAIIAVGDFDAKEMEQKIKTRFSTLPASPKPVVREFYEVPDHKEVLAKVATDPEATFTTISVNYKNDKQEYTTADDYRKTIMQDLYNQMLNARLEELNSKSDPPFVFYYSGFSSLTRTKDAYTSMGYVKEDGIMRGLETLLTETERIQRHGFTESELERAKKELLRNKEKSFAERDKQPSRSLIWGYVSNFLDNDPAPGIEYEFETTGAMLPGIKLEDVNRIADKWINDENVVIIVTAPEKEGLEIPSEDAFIQKFREIEETEILPYEDELTAATLMDERPAPGEITSVKTYDDLGVTELVLENGARVVLKPTDFKNDEILFTAYSLGGTSLYGDEDYYSADFSSGLIGESGLKDFSGTDISKILAGKVAGVNPYVRALSEGFSGSASAEDLEIMLQLVNLYFTAPRRDDESFNSYVQRQQALYQNLGSNPQYFFLNEVEQIMSRNHMRSKFLLSEEEFKKVDFDKAYSIYQERFANAGDFTFFLVGNFDKEEIKPLLQSYIGSLPGGPAKENFKDIGIRYPEGKVDKILKKGQDPKSMVSLNFTGDHDYEKMNNKRLEWLTEVMSIKLREKLREDEGGVYGVRVSNRKNKYPNQDYRVSISFTCDPQKADSLIALALREIDKLKKGEIEEKDINKVKEKEKRELETNLKENRFWLNKLRSAYYHQEDPGELLSDKNAVDNLAAKDIKKAAHEYLDMKNYARIVLFPETTTPAASKP